MKVVQPDQVGSALVSTADRIAAAGRRAASRVVASLAAEVATKAKMPGYVPVRSGVLRDSIVPTKTPGRPDTFEWTVGSNVEYAIPVEYGTRNKDESVRMAARPFLRRALVDVGKDAEEMAREIIREEMARP